MNIKHPQRGHHHKRGVMSAIVCLAFVLLTESCDSGTPAVSFEALPTTLPTLVCGIRYRCCTTDDLERVSTGTESACREIETDATLRFRLPRYKASLALKRVRYDGEILAACVAVYSSGSCPVASSQNAIDCSRWLQPLVGVGGACNEHWECQTGYCDWDGTNGHCAAKRSDGQSCATWTAKQTIALSASACCGPRKPPQRSPGQQEASRSRSRVGSTCERSSHGSGSRRSTRSRSDERWRVGS